MADKVKKLVEEIEKLTLVEASELVKALEEKFGVSAAAMAVAAAPAAGAAPAAAADAGAAAKSEFDVFLKDAGANKINVIKAVKEITGLGLGDAKALVDGAPKVIKEKVPAEEAKKFEAMLKEAGATVELK